ncbi:MAG: hypothetical protein MJ252_01930 [archaeon]|nr:hypothetical protein [archaeon]
MEKSGNQKIKTINLSKAGNQEKAKLNQFIKDNNIQFNNDENGKEIAMVKFEKSKTKTNNKKETQKENPKVSSKGDKKENTIKNTPKANEANIANMDLNQQEKGVDQNESRKKTKTLKPLPTQYYYESFGQNYPTFFPLVKPLLGIRPRKIALYDLKFYIEEIYSVAMFKYSHIAKSLDPSTNFEDGSDGIISNEQSGEPGLSSGRPNLTEQLLPFPHFVYEFLSNKFAKKALIDQNITNILLTMEYYKDLNGEIKLFSNFLNETYSINDLILFLTIRGIIERELRVLYLEKAKDETKIQHMEDKDEILCDIYLSTPIIQKVISVLFNSTDEILYNHVVSKFANDFIRDPHNKFYNTIPSAIFIITLVDDFHSSRELNNINTNSGNPSYYTNSKGIANVPFFYNRANEFFNDSGEPEQKMENEEEKKMEEGEETKEEKPNDVNKYFSDAEKYSNMLNYLSENGKSFYENVKYAIMIYMKEKDVLDYLEKFLENLIKNKKKLMNEEGDNNIDLSEFNSFAPGYDLSNAKGIENFVYEVREQVMRKIFYLIEIIFHDDIYAWNASFISNEGEDEETYIQNINVMVNSEDFIMLNNIKTDMLNYKNIVDLPKELVEKFSGTLLSIQKVSDQINRIIMNKKNEKEETVSAYGTANKSKC